MVPLQFPKKLLNVSGLTRQLTLIGVFITSTFFLIALFAPWLQAWGIFQDPTDLLSNYPLQAPSREHWFGTNKLFANAIFFPKAINSMGTESAPRTGNE
jgi:peptide/nickel transport system permease protein